jgi:hypothetical protein
MKDLLLRPTSTLSQPGSIISDGDIRRRGELIVFIRLVQKFFVSSVRQCRKQVWLLKDNSLLLDPSVFSKTKDYLIDLGLN